MQRLKNIEEEGAERFKSQRARDSSVKYYILEITGNLTHDNLNLTAVGSITIFSTRDETHNLL